MPIETVMLDAVDGVRLRGDVQRVSDARATVVLAHSHPLYGGDRYTPIVEMLFGALSDAGFTTLRFD